MYDIEWPVPSECSAGSMPVGGYSMGCNVWAQNDELCIYVAESGAIDENGTMLKLCRLRFWLDPRERFAVKFKQRFSLNTGAVTVAVGEKGSRIEFKIWACENKSELHIEFRSEKKQSLMMSFDSWRCHDRKITEEEVSQCRDLEGDLDDAYTRKDTVLPENGRMLFFHKNRNDISLWKKLLKMQQLWDERSSVPDLLCGRTFGGLLQADGMKYVGCKQGIFAGCDQNEYLFESNAVDSQDIILTVHSSQEENWEQSLMHKAALPAKYESSVNWWQEQFEKSYIIIDPQHKSGKYFEYGRNYQLFRYMLLCGRCGEFPTKFNGGLFTFDEGRPTPDYRAWSGAGFTAQNQRLLYWPMLKSGDFDAMPPQFEYYSRTLSAAKTRVRKFFGHEGAFFFEQGNLFGLCTGSEYTNHGTTRTPQLNPAEDDNPFVRLHYSTGIEFALMIMEYHRYSKKDISGYMDLVESMLLFYFEHYRVKNGKLFIFPSTALETYKGKDPTSRDDFIYGCVNPMDAVAGIRCLCNSLITYYQNDSKKRVQYQKMLELCPPFPCGKNKNGDDIYLPAEKFGSVPFNCELPQLYNVFPYGCIGLTEEEKQIAVNTYFEQYDSPYQYAGFGWHQNGIFATKLRLLEEAEDYLQIKLADAPKRFPAFWGPGHDWTPDHNHGGSAMIGLQEMLIDTDGDKTEFFPTWDKNVDVSFRLHIPGLKVAEGEILNGRIVKKEIK